MSSSNGQIKTSTQAADSRSNYVNLKLVLRLLPPTLTREQFLEQLNNYTNLLNDGSIVDNYYVQGFYPTKPYEKPTYSRAYLLFKNQTLIDQFLKEVSGKSFIEHETNDSFIPSVRKALYYKMPNSKMNSSVQISKKYEDDVFYKEFLALMETKTEAFDILSINKNLKKKNKEKKKKEKDPKKKDPKKNKAKDESKTTAKPNPENPENPVKTDSPKTSKTRKRNRNKKTEGETTKGKPKTKTPNEPKDQQTPAASKPKPKSKQGTPKTTNPELKNRQKDSKAKQKQTQELKEQLIQSTPGKNEDTSKPKPNIKVKQKPQKPAKKLTTESSRIEEGS